MPAAEPAPVGEGELGGLFDFLADRRAVGLAVSGGPDSLALMLLAQRWRSGLAAGPAFVVFTVDHGLRPEAAAEARAVAKIAKRLGLQHRTLNWDGAKPTAGVEEAAREARYRLLLQAAREAGIGDILTAHHRDDQVETLLMRLGRGSGLTGLAAMRRERPLGDGVTLHRPLLDMPKARLVATVEAAGLAAAEDASNSDMRFARARLRAAMPALAAAGIDGAGVAQAARRLARADDALAHYADALIASAARFDALGVASLDRPAFAAAPVEVRLRALGRILAGVSGSDWPPPRSERLEALDRAIVEAAGFKRTLGGAVVAAAGAVATVMRESGRSSPPSIAVGPGDAGVWDGRFAFAIEKAPAGLVIGPLGVADVGAVGRGRGPAAAWATLPALRVAGEIVAVPPAGVTLAGASSVRADFRSVVEDRVRR